MVFLAFPFLRLIIVIVSLYLAWSIIYNPGLNWEEILEQRHHPTAGVARGVLLLSLAALFYSSALAVLMTPGPLLTALTTNREVFPAYATWLILPTLMNLLWLILAALLVWFLVRQIRWANLMRFISWQPTRLQQFFLYLEVPFISF